MSILSSNRLNENQISHYIFNFLSNFQVIRLFRACGGDKAKGISVECLFAYILSNVFRASSFYMQQRDSKWQKRFSKNTYQETFLRPSDTLAQAYRQRWDIEVFFKTCKSYLHLRSYHGLSYDALTAHVDFVFTRYMLLSVAKRNDEDMRTLGELFYMMVEEMTDVTFHKSMLILQEAMRASVKTIFHATEKQIQAVLADFVNRLPQYMRDALQVSAV